MEWGIIKKARQQRTRLEKKGIRTDATEAYKIAEPGDTVLLSPTTSSFDQYSGFEERGDHFKQIVNSL